MKALKDLRKSKGLALNALSGKCGVSTKTLLKYEHEPQKRLSKKVVGKISSALGVSSEDFMMTGTVEIAETQPDEESILLKDYHIVRLLSPIENEIREVQLMMLDYADVQDEHPALLKELD
jgi:transcriptional regulator with XRE-family HTH domain